MNALNIIGPKVRRLRHQRGWSQNDLAIRLQLLGMEDGTRGKISKIESRIIWVSDEDMLYLARALKVDLNDLYAAVIHNSRLLYKVIKEVKSSRYGVS
jgi:transcriptional regulator with XRE-family HTH domain